MRPSKATCILYSSTTKHTSIDSKARTCISYCYSGNKPKLILKCEGPKGGDTNSYFVCLPTVIASTYIEKKTIFKAPKNSQPPTTPSGHTESNLCINSVCHTKTHTHSQHHIPVTAPTTAVLGGYLET